MSNQSAYAVASKSQVVELQSLFSSYGATFHIKSADQQTAFVRVYLYSVVTYKACSFRPVDKRGGV